MPWCHVYIGDHRRGANKEPPEKNSRHWRRFLQPEMRSNDSDRRSSLPVLSVPSKGSSHKNVLAQVPSPKASEDSCPEAEVNLAKAQAPF
ncbi:hypothetical protein MRX96_005479 [Rhipicephalus microplus]